MPLREDQTADVDRLRAAFAAGFRAPLLVRGTGTGKTFIFSTIAERICRGGKRVIALCHRDELLTQIGKTFATVGLPHGVIAAGSYYDVRLPAHVASVATLVRRLDRVAVPDYVIIDEAHHAILKSLYGKILAYWLERNPALRYFGVTATPVRLSGEGLGETFDEMIVGLQTADAIEIGVLSPYRLIAPPAHARVREGLHKVGGELSRKELTQLFRDRPAITGDAIHHYRKYLDGAPTIAFCHSVEEAERVAEKFRAAGYRAASLDGNTERNIVRPGILRDLESGALSVLTSCQIVDEGFDCPGVVGILDLYPTESLARAMQRWGRAMRKFAGKDAAIIIDSVGNTGATVNGVFVPKHGLPDDHREWSLEGRAKGKGGKSDAPGCRQCATCYAISPLAASKCRSCGVPFPVKERQIETVDGELTEIEVARLKREAVVEQAQAKTLEDLLALAKAKGRQPGWAHHVFAARQKKEQERIATIQARRAAREMTP